MREIRNVAIAGAGTMGASLAQAFAKYGYLPWRKPGASSA